MTWKELKEFCNSLDEKELSKKVILWREDEAITKITAETLHEDCYAVDDGEGCVYESEKSCLLRDDEDVEIKKVYDKGTPILWEEF